MRVFKRRCLPCDLQDTLVSLDLCDVFTADKSKIRGSNEGFHEFSHTADMDALPVRTPLYGDS